MGNGSLWLFLDNNLIMQNSDNLTLELNRDEEFMVYWFVNGIPGSSYTIAISSPRDAQFQLTRMIGKAGKDHGSFQFRT